MAIYECRVGAVNKTIYKSDGDYMNILVVKKSNNAVKDRAVEKIWSLISKKYNYPLHIGKGYIIGRVPDIGDAKAATDFFKKYPKIEVFPHDNYNLDEAIAVYDSLLVEGIEMGRAALIEILSDTGMEYELFDVMRI